MQIMLDLAKMTRANAVGQQRGSGPGIAWFAPRAYRHCQCKLGLPRCHLGFSMRRCPGACQPRLTAKPRRELAAATASWRPPERGRGRAAV